MRTFCKSSGLIVIALVLSLGIGTADGASKFPEKPITLVVGSGPGSGVDILGRVIAATFEKHKLLPQPIVVENKTGGSHAVAMAYVGGKKKDPYYLMAVTTLLLLTPLQGNSPINYKDFTPICNLSFDENVLIVNVNSKYKSIMDVVADAKANPEKITMAGSNFGGPGHINTYLIEKAAGIKLKFVSFSGGGDALVALLGGHVDLTLLNPTEVMELLKAKKVRVLGVLPEKRLAGFPDLPTLKEQGVNVLGIGMNRGLCAPGGIPEDARKILEEAFFKFTKTEEYKKLHRDNIITEGWLDGAAFSKYLDQENERSAAILKDMGLLKK